jgi:hypothetical protein
MKLMTRQESSQAVLHLMGETRYKVSTSGDQGYSPGRTKDDRAREGGSGALGVLVGPLATAPVVVASSKAPLYAGGGVAIVILVVILVLLMRRDAQKSGNSQKSKDKGQAKSNAPSAPSATWQPAAAPGWHTQSAGQSGFAGSGWNPAQAQGIAPAGAQGGTSGAAPGMPGISSSVATPEQGFGAAGQGIAGAASNPWAQSSPTQAGGATGTTGASSSAPWANLDPLPQQQSSAGTWNASQAQQAAFGGSGLGVGASVAQPGQAPQPTQQEAASTTTTGGGQAQPVGSTMASNQPTDQGVAQGASQSAAQQASATPSIPSGWYPDPGAPGTKMLRWWDGHQWTEHVHPGQ